jgi:hypothetical protein
VRTLVRQYTERSARTFLQQVAMAGPATATAPQQQVAQQASAQATASSSTVGTAPKIADLPVQPTYNEPVTSLVRLCITVELRRVIISSCLQALVRVGPAPAKYCVKGRIDSWSPANIKE